MMTVDAIMIEAKNLNDEELNNLVKKIYDLKTDREKSKKDEAIQKLREAFETVTSLGIDIYDTEGCLVKSFEDLECYY